MNAFDSLGDLLIIVDNDGTILHVNATAAKRLADSESALIGKSVLDLYAEKDQIDVSKMLQETKSGDMAILNKPLIARTRERIETNTRIVRGKHAGNDVLFIVFREF
jgi:PAS domain S-box-containing protein